MNSRDYWQKREEEALKHYVKDEAVYDKEIKQIYQTMLDSVQEQIDGFYGQYAAKEGISLTEAKKRVSSLNVKRFERKAKRYVREKNFSKHANDGLRLYNATMKINRLEMLKANIGLELISGHNELEKFMEGVLQGRTEEELAWQAGILGKAVRNNAKTAHAIVNGSFHNGTFSDRIWQYQDLMREDLGRLLQTGLIQGKNPRALAKDLKKYWYGADPRTGGGATYCMERLMRTELARVQTEAQKQSFERNDFDEYMFISNEHGNTCKICNGLDGKHFKVKDMMPGLNAPPMHPHCRCSTAAWVDDEEYEAWLDYLDKGGTTKEWEASGKTAWEKQQKAKTPVEKPRNGSIIKSNSGGQFYCYGDYLRDKLGSAKDNNAEELSSIITEVQNLGGSFEMLKDRAKMVTNVMKGAPGIIEMDENASIGAVMHEYRHFMDDIENGCPGFAYYLMNQDAFWEYEKRGYLEELKIAKEHNFQDIVKKIEAEMEKRRREIYGID